MVIISTSLSIIEAQNLFNEILNDENYEQSNDSDICPISGEVLDKNAISLPCGHKFNYKALVIDQLKCRQYNRGDTSKCPYCRRHYSGKIPYRPDICGLRATGINNPVSESFIKHDCINTKAGESCKINATIPVGDKFACYRHYKSALKTLSKTQASDQTRKCQAILKSGKSKGNICGATIKDTGIEYCKRHYKP